jgi:hypothetical protein
MRTPAGVNDLASRAPSDPAAQPLEELARDLLFALDHPALRPFRADWPSSRADRAAPTAAPQSAAPLPVLDYLPAIAAARHDFAAALIQALCRAAPALRWRQTYSTAQIDAAFLRNYGYTEIIGPTAPRECRQLACGFLLLGPHTHYPRHLHEAEEIYVSLAGRAGWLQGDAVWRDHPPGTVIHHTSGEPHAMRTADAPLLALYVWRSADLNQTARLVTA